MEQLSHLLGRSPRTLKRFVNVYRLFKVSEPDVLVFADADRPDAPFRVVLYLLARVTSRSETAPRLFEAIRSADPEDRSVLVDLPEDWSITSNDCTPWLDKVARYGFRAPNETKRMVFNPKTSEPRSDLESNAVQTPSPSA